MISDLKYFLKHASNITSCGKLGFTFVLSANVMITFVCKHMKDMYKKHMKFNLKVTMINLDYRGALDLHSSFISARGQNAKPTLTKMSLHGSEKSQTSRVYDRRMR